MKTLGSPKVQYFKTGTVEYLIGGKIYTYEVGTTTPRATYPTFEDAIAGTNQLSNPIVLDSRGEAMVIVTGPTKVVVKDADDNELWTVDNVDTVASDITDGSGNLVLQFGSTTDAVNYVKITNTASGTPPIVESKGSDTNVGLTIRSQNAGAINITSGTGGEINLSASSSGAVNVQSPLVLEDTTTVEDTLNIAAGVAITFAGNPMSNLLPPGIILPFGGSSVPTGFLQCDGSAVSRVTYASLFAILGTTWGSGNGSTTFNLPDLRRRTIVGSGGTGTATLGSTVGSTGGAETHTLSQAEMPAHTHSYSVSTYNYVYDAGGGGQACNQNVAGTTGSTGSSAAHNNMQPSAVILAIIKY